MGVDSPPLTDEEIETLLTVSSGSSQGGFVTSTDVQGVGFLLLITLSVTLFSGSVLFAFWKRSLIPLRIFLAGSTMALVILATLAGATISQGGSIANGLVSMFDMPTSGYIVLAICTAFGILVETIREARRRSKAQRMAKQETAVFE